MLTRSSRVTWATIALCLAITPVASCTSDAPTRGASSPPSAAATRPLPSGDTPVRIQLHRSGGIAGTTETVIVDTDGSWTYSGSGGDEQHGTLSRAESQSLWRLANDPALAAEVKAAGPPSTCADGYDIGVAFGDDRRLQVRDCGALPPRFKALVALLREATPL